MNTAAIVADDEWGKLLVFDDVTPNQQQSERDSWYVCIYDDLCCKFFSNFFFRKTIAISGFTCSQCDLWSI